MAKRQFNRKPVKRRIFLFMANKNWIKISLTIIGVFFLVSAITVLWWSKDLPNPKNLSSQKAAESTKIMDRTGEHILYEIGDIHRTVIPLEQISNYVRQATLAAEDSDFYRHHGLDFKGIFRGVILKPLSGSRAQGGSTITQQLVKNSILTPERTIRRKVKEAVLALELEQKFSKDEILAMYLNQIPYGSRAYGIQAASKTFFNKSASDLTLSEATLLAALPKAPSYYSPYGSHFEDLKNRQEYILNQMSSLKMITKDQAAVAKQEKVEFVLRKESITAPHFVFYVKELLDKEFGERVVEQGGLKIITTLDTDMQTIAESVLEKNAARIKSLGASNAALTAINPKNGDIVSMVGSIGYFNKDIDGNVNVSIRHRSPGSSIKPFIYAATFQKGYTPETILVDAETDFGQGYKPKNYDLSEHGPVTMRVALANSLNIPAVKALYLAGIKEATKLAHDMGMTSLDDPDRYGLSLVLGGGEVRLIDEVSAYGVFANDGVHFPHRAILKVTAGNETLFDADKEERTGQQIIEPQTARLTTDVLADNNARSLTFGTRSYLQLGNRPVAAKTGTTQDYRDGWTMGYTPSLAAGVWVGNNNNSPMGKKAAGANTAAPIWNAFMRQALANKPIENFVKPESQQNIPHSILRGKLPEVKGRWDYNTGTIYTAECPIATGKMKTFQELHNLLFYVRRDTPLGNPPSNAENDPQFDNWEKGVNDWREKHNKKTKDDPKEIYYGQSLPEPICNIENSEDIPKVHIIEPNTTILRESPTTIKVSIDSQKPLKEIRFLLDGEEIAKKNPDQEYQATISFPENFSGRKTLLILAVTKNNLIGRAHRTFIINPDNSEPSVTLHTPKNGQTLNASTFPITVKITASDPSGVQLVDVLYHKEGASGTSRIGRTSKLSPTAPNRYEVTWNDSPGPGTYYVYTIVYDKTGNFKESPTHTVIIQ